MIKVSDSHVVFEELPEATNPPCINGPLKRSSTGFARSLQEEIQSKLEKVNLTNFERKDQLGERKKLAILLSNLADFEADIRTNLEAGAHYFTCGLDGRQGLPFLVPLVLISMFGKQPTSNPGKRPIIPDQ